LTYKQELVVLLMLMVNRKGHDRHGLNGEPLPDDDMIPE
jgi:hypothetical protein